MNAKKAISILKFQQAKLEEVSKIDDDWINQTSDYLKIFLGSSSHQYLQLKDDTFHGKSMRVHFRQAYFFKEQVEKYYRMIDYAIEYIENNGLYKPPVQNILWKISDKALVAVLLFVISTCTSVGYIAGQSLSDQKQLVEIERLKLENERLKLRDVPIFQNGNNKTQKKTNDTIEQEMSNKKSHD